MRGKSESPAARNFTSLSNHLQTSKDSLYYFSFDFQNFHKESMCEYMYEHVREFQGFCWEHEIKIEVIFHVQYIKSVCRLPLKKN